jgi:hypothetical protein
VRALWGGLGLPPGVERSGPGTDTAEKILRRLERIEERQGEILDRLDAGENGTALLSPAELARKLRKSRTWTYEHASELGAIRLGSGPRPRLMFDLELARQRLAGMAGGNGSKPEPAPKSRRRRSSADVELLPIRERNR